MSGDHSVVRPRTGVRSGWSDGDDYDLINQTIDTFDGILQNAPVVTRTLSGPPASPADGAMYLMPSGALTGAWSGYSTGQLAEWFQREGVWRPYTPKEGWTCYLQDENLELRHNGSAWVQGLGYLWIPAGLWRGQATDEVRGTAPNTCPVRKYLTAVDTADVAVVPIPDDWASLASIKLYYASEGTSATAVKWRVGWAGDVAAGSSIVAAITFGAVLTQAPPGVADQLDIRTLGTPSGTPAPGQTWRIVLQRQGTVDTNPDAQAVEKLLLTYNRTQK